jgi:hypothetical protein
MHKGAAARQEGVEFESGQQRVDGVGGDTARDERCALPARLRAGAPIDRVATHLALNGTARQQSSTSEGERRVSEGSAQSCAVAAAKQASNATQSRDAILRAAVLLHAVPNT